MEGCDVSSLSGDEGSVFGLVTKLCEKITSQHSKCHQFYRRDRKLIKKLRSRAFEYLLRKSDDAVERNVDSDGVVDLLSCYFLKDQNKESVCDYYDLVAIKEKIDWIISSDVVKKVDTFSDVLTCIVRLSDTVPGDGGRQAFHNPFTFGKLDQIIPNLEDVTGSDPKPYRHFPWQIFELPFSIKIDVDDNTPYPYSLQSFTAKPGTKLSHLGTLSEHSNDSSQESPPSTYTNVLSDFSGYPRLSRPRDLNIPIEKNKPPVNIKFNINIVQDVPIVLSNNFIESGPPATLWELASLESNTGLDLWEEASKSKPIVKRNFISSSAKQMLGWRRTHMKKMNSLQVVSEPQFILHLKYLTIGIESSSFQLDKCAEKFVMKPNLCVEGLYQITLNSYVAEFLKIGTSYWKLNNLSTPTHSEDGFIFKVSYDNIKRFLVWFRLEIDKVFGEGLVVLGSDESRLPTMMEIGQKIKPLSVHIHTMLSVFKNCEENRGVISSGLMAELYKSITTVTHLDISPILYAMLKKTCTVYFRFIQKFIFEGHLDDRFDEFFIKKDVQHSESFNKRYWNKGYVIKNEENIPVFLHGLAKHILLCGKSLRLLKLCNPTDPLCMMLTSDYPQIKCCFSFDEIESQQILYDQYRTQCLYVCGEPITFDTIMMQKDAEKRAFREFLIHKQVENLERVVEERKRLSRLLQAKKKEQFNALREAAENAIKRRKQEKENEIKEEKLILDHAKICDKIRKIEMQEQKQKVMTFYEEIGREVEQRHIMTDWKIKRLKLDQKRGQLITSEKMNLNREKLETDHRNVVDIVPVQTIDDAENLINENLSETAKSDAKLTDDNANVAETTSIGVAPSTDHDRQKIDDIINDNVPTDGRLSKSDIENSNLFASTDEMYRCRKMEAIRNKLKVMSHEFGTGAETTGAETSGTSVREDPRLLSAVNNNLTELQKNKLKVLGSNVNAPAPDINFNNVPQPSTEASKQALLNKQKVLGFEYGIESTRSQTESFKRVGLSLDLEKCKTRTKYDWRSQTKAESKSTLNDFTPGSYTNTPAEMGIGFDIETPSTFDIGPFGLPSTATLSPTSAQVNDNTENIPISSKGFHFPNIVEAYSSDDDNDKNDEEIDGVKSNDIESTVENDYDFVVKPSVWNFIDDELNFDRFNPFGIEKTPADVVGTMEIFERRLVLDGGRSPYADIKDIIETVEKQPMEGTFSMINVEDDSDADMERIENADLSSIATCLQRSVMIPLTCQMELVNNAILKYFLVNCDLYDHMRNIRDYFFLMDGEFAKVFCTNLFDKLKTIENPRDLLNFATLHTILDKSCGSAGCGANKYTENLSFAMSEPPLSFRHSSPDVLENLTLTYSVGWPMNIIFSQEAMDRYAKIFNFLIKVRRISWALEHDSEVLKKSMKDEFMVARELLYSPQYHSVQLYRYIMSSLIRAINSYIQTTCLQTSWSELEGDLSTARTLDDLYSVHVIYIKKVLFRCLLNKRSEPIMKILNEIFTVVLRFHHVLNARCWHIAGNEIHYTHPLFPQIRELFNTFEKLSRHFHKTVTRLTDCGYQPHLAELLSVINMNNYYCRSPHKK